MLTVMLHDVDGACAGANGGSAVGLGGYMEGGRSKHCPRGSDTRFRQGGVQAPCYRRGHGGVAVCTTDKDSQGCVVALADHGVVLTPYGARVHECASGTLGLAHTDRCSCD